MHANDLQQAPQQAVVLSNTRIARHTYHLRIQSPCFATMDYVPGFTLDLFLGNPHTLPGTDTRKYSFWNYEPVQQIADIAICTFSNGPGSRWVKTLRQSDRVYFKKPKGKLLISQEAEQYLLIGDITALSHLYEINRNLEMNKQVFSYIYTQHPEDIFPDLDQSFPFDYHIFSADPPTVIAAQIIAALPSARNPTLAYILGAPQVCIAVHNYMKEQLGFEPAQLKTKPFWKEERLIENTLSR